LTPIFFCISKQRKLKKTKKKVVGVHRGHFYAFLRSEKYKGCKSASLTILCTSNDSWTFSKSEIQFFNRI